MRLEGHQCIFTHVRQKFQDYISKCRRGSPPLYEGMFGRFGAASGLEDCRCIFAHAHAHSNSNRSCAPTTRQCSNERFLYASAMF